MTKVPDGQRDPGGAPAGRTPRPAGRVLVVDDQAANRSMLTALLERDGHIVTTAVDGRQALEAVVRDEPDLVLMDLVMPNLDGVEACRALKSDPTTRLLPVILMTGLGDVDARMRGIEAGADDFVTKPFRHHELRARVRSLVNTKHYVDDLDPVASLMVSVALTLESRDPCTSGHCHRVAHQARALGARLGLDDGDLMTLERGGYVHDLGKIGIPDAILLKPGVLTRAEYEQVKTHTVIGDRLCRGVKSLRRVRSIVRSHHERLDGSGYPDGLRGDAIPLSVQITGIVDVFDALTMKRPYRDAYSAGRAFETLEKEAVLGWHRRDLVEAFITIASAPAEASA